ncbi:MAG: class I tRNA ligase family protein, partial [Mycobacteriales bacterium]
SEVVSSEYLTQEGRKFSSSRQVVIYVGDFLARYQPDALRYYLAVNGPESADTDFTWEQFVTRTNTELVAGWGNLVNRTVSMTAKNLGAIPSAGTLTDDDRALLAAGESAYAAVGSLLDRSRVKAATTESMRVIGEANKYLSDQAPWKIRESDPARYETVLHVALQLVRDGATLLTPVLPHSSNEVHRMLGGEGAWSPLPEMVDVDDLDGGPGYPILRGDYAAGSARWGRTPIVPGTPLAPPTPLFTKLDPSVVDEELARMAGE